MPPQSNDFNTNKAGPDNGLALWSAFHARLERVVALFERLVEHVRRDSDVDKGAQSTAAMLLDYFNQAAPRHHEDEERDIFPLLLKRLAENPGAPGAADTVHAIAQLKRDHQDLATLWAALRPHLEGIAAGQRSVPAAELTLLFTGRYRQHCGLEATLVHERMLALVTPADLAAIATPMLQRRDIDPAASTAD